jgi:hypothetical protein
LQYGYEITVTIVGSSRSAGEADGDGLDITTARRAVNKFSISIVRKT